MKNNLPLSSAPHPLSLSHCEASSFFPRFFFYPILGVPTQLLALVPLDTIESASFLPVPFYSFPLGGIYTELLSLPAMVQLFHRSFFRPPRRRPRPSFLCATAKENLRVETAGHGKNTITNASANEFGSQIYGVV